VVHGELTDIDRLKEAIRGSSGVLYARGPTSLQHPKDLPITPSPRPKRSGSLIRFPLAAYDAERAQAAIASALDQVILERHEKSAFR
jgi:hypothetical protein